MGFQSEPLERAVSLGVSWIMTTTFILLIFASVLTLLVGANVRYWRRRSRLSKSQKEREERHEEREAAIW
jgi:hypothetical protein